MGCNIYTTERGQTTPMDCNINITEGGQLTWAVAYILLRGSTHMGCNIYTTEGGSDNSHGL